METVDYCRKEPVTRYLLELERVYCVDELTSVNYMVRDERVRGDPENRQKKRTKTLSCQLDRRSLPGALPRTGSSTLHDNGNHCAGSGYPATSEGQRRFNADERAAAAVALRAWIPTRSSVVVNKKQLMECLSPNGQG